ncbi:MAG: hypothetical protein FJ398_01750 [Verrucomicrobia bacterium]|nr:hypothetical protein [Verrucomicrobiota bacterium]
MTTTILGFIALGLLHISTAAPAIQRVQIGPVADRSQVPEVTAQGRFLSPQAVSTIDISADGKVVTVGTMAFSHDANVWQFAPDGTILAKRHFPPWAPMQAATLPGARAVAVGLAYSRVTSPDPTVWFGRAENLWAGNLTDDLVEADSRDAQLARLRPGAGDWRAGWFASVFGELFVRGPDWIFKPPAQFLDADGQRLQLRHADNNLLPTSRAMRMTSSQDGKRVAFGWLGFSRNIPGLPTHADAVSVWRVKPNEQLWSALPSLTNTPPSLPDPAQDMLHRCWGDIEKARALAPVIRDKLLAWRPDIVFTGHGVRPNGTEFIEALVQRTEKSLLEK